MKKFFLFAAAAVAALTVNAKVISFGGIVNKESQDLAISSFKAAFNLSNINVSAAQNNDKTAWYAEVTQTTKTTEWGVTTAKLKADAQAYFDFKDGNDNKLVMKAYNEYVQPNGKAVCLVISRLNNGDKVTINLNKALNKESMIEGATVGSDKFESTSVELTAASNEIRIYSKSVDGGADAKWQIVSVEVPGETGIEGVNAESVKAVKRVVDGQVVIERDGRLFNLLGAEIAR